MSTRSLTVFEDHGTEIVVVYRHMDGYPSEHGQALAEFLAAHHLVNGFCPGDRAPGIQANGMNHLAALTVAHFTPIASVYLNPAGARDMGEEYVYTVYEKDNAIRLRCQVGCSMVTIFDGLPAKWNTKTVDLQPLPRKAKTAKIPADALTVAALA